MIRRSIVPAAVVVLFIAGSLLAVSPLIAEICAARGDYETALRFDPLNAKYHGEIGRQYLKEGREGMKIDRLELAREAYRKAMVLSPMDSTYRLGWGEAQALFLLRKKDASAEEMAEYTENFRRAVALDPTNYYVNSTAGYYILLFRNKLGKADRNFAIYRLRLSLEQNPGYANRVFSYVANGLGDFGLLYKITPQTPAWQQALRDFLRDIDRWKYGLK